MACMNTDEQKSLLPVQDVLLTLVYNLQSRSSNLFLLKTRQFWQLSSMMMASLNMCGLKA